MNAKFIGQADLEEENLAWNCFAPRGDLSLAIRWFSTPPVETFLLET